MPWFDLPLEEMRQYRTSAQEPPDLDDWWQARLSEARAAAAPPRVTPYLPEVYGDISAFDVEFSGAGGDPIRGWYLRPRGRADADLPTVVRFVGYGGGRGLPADHALLPAVGFALFVMDVRGQGGRWTIGATGDTGHWPEYSAVMTRGIARPDEYYFGRLYVDAVRAVEAVRELPGVDAARIAVSGGSQGGGLALATAALLGPAIKVCHADVPFLCDIGRAVTLSPRMPYAEVAEFLAQHIDMVPAALNTLRYVDCALLARRITADCLLSAGLMDETCPPSTVFAAYNEIHAPKDIAVFEFGAHSVPPAHVERQLRHLRERLLHG
jgi:cephalosporin-C deacetylase